MAQNVFERYPKSTLLLIVVFFSCLLVVLLEVLAGKLFGLGKTITYEAHPIYGYRPCANQVVARNAQHTIKINNLQLRAQSDWNEEDYFHKIVFMGDSVTYGGSYIDNQQLFSYLAVKNIPPYEAGNAGVNGWGVNNVHGLIMEMNFLPAQIYVSVFPEGDFYRGLMRLGGQPFWTKKPEYALEELFHYLVYKAHLSKTPTPNFAEWAPEERMKIAEIAVRNLKAMDDFLLANNRNHFIYITPSRSHLLGKEQKDPVLKMLFAKYQLPVIYLQDRIDLPADKISELFHDEIHLSVKGHQLWATLMLPELEKIAQYHEKHSLVAYAN